MKKRIGILLLSFVLVMSLMPLSAFAASSNYTKVKASQYTKLMQGKLTKKQVEWVIESLVFKAQSTSGTNPVSLTKKQTKELGKDNMVNRIALYGAKMYYPDYRSYSSKSQKDQWDEAHNLKESNRILSFYTNYRYKKNKSEKNDWNSGYLWRTTSKKLYYYGGIGYGYNCSITSAKKSGKKIVLKVQRSGTYANNQVIAKYTVVLKKQKNGKFALNSIKQTWRKTF